jgi:hypothetical protein
VVVVVIVVGYFLLSGPGKQRRRQNVAADFAKMADFHANQVFTDVRGETAIGLDDRGRRIAVARRHAQPRTKLYSFAHIISAELVQNGTVIAVVAKGVSGQSAAAEGGRAGKTPADGGEAESSLFGSTGRGVLGIPVIAPAPGSMTMLGVRVTVRDASDAGVLIRFYEGKAIDAAGVAGEKAFADARVCLAALDVAIKRAGLPPRPAIV